MNKYEHTGLWLAVILSLTWPLWMGKTDNTPFKLSQRIQALESKDTPDFVLRNEIIPSTFKGQFNDDKTVYKRSSILGR